MVHFLSNFNFNLRSEQHSLIGAMIGYSVYILRTGVYMKDVNKLTVNYDALRSSEGSGNLNALC